MRVQLRIVAGSLRGRKLNCDIHEGIRPTPQMVREALFSILGNAVPGRPFYDIFAGTGAIGLEGLSRGASEVVFVERDLSLAGVLEKHLRAFGVEEPCRILRTDVYRWVGRWKAPAVPITIFVSPPFPDYQNRIEALASLVIDLKAKSAPGSVLVLQGEKSQEFDGLVTDEAWDVRKYGRNFLAFWVKPLESGPEEPKVEATEEE